MRKYLSLLIFFSALASAQTAPQRYEINKEMPLYLDRIKESLTYPLAWGNSEITDYQLWQQMAREKVFECMLVPPPPSSSYDMTVISTDKREGYRVEYIEFNISDYSRVPAYLAIPDGKGPFPAVVMLHDHGAKFSIGKEKMIRPFGVSDDVLAESDKWAEQCYDSQYVGDYLAQNGYVVISVDALFWGERGRKEGVNYDMQQALACNMEMLGRSWSGTITYEDIYTVDFLESLKFVDKSRIGCFGFSMGGYRSWMLAALSDKVKAGAAACWMITTDAQLAWDARTSKGASAFSMLLPGVRNYLDYPHIASIACPKPMLFYAGATDKLFPIDGVKDAFGTITRVWESQEAESRLQTRIWDLPHFCSKPMQQEILEFFDKNLSKSKHKKRGSKN